MWRKTFFWKKNKENTTTTQQLEETRQSLEETQKQTEETENNLINTLNSDKKIIEIFFEIDNYKKLSLLEIQSIIEELSDIKDKKLKALDALIDQKEYSQLKSEQVFTEDIKTKKIISFLIQQDFDINKLIESNQINPIKNHKFVIERGKLIDKTNEAEYLRKSKELAKNSGKYSEAFTWLVSNREEQNNSRYTPYELGQIAQEFTEKTNTLKELEKWINPYIILSIWYKSISLKELVQELKNYISVHNQKILAKHSTYEDNTLEDMIYSLKKIYEKRPLASELTKSHYNATYNTLVQQILQIESVLSTIQSNEDLDSNKIQAIKSIYENNNQ